VGILNPNFEVLEKNITRVEPKPRNWQGKGVDGGAQQLVELSSSPPGKVSRITACPHHFYFF
jgi:hypothetical protein